MSGVHIDLLKDWYGHTDKLRPAAENTENDESPQKLPNIVSTFDLIHLIGWKFDPTQQVAKERATADFSLR